MCEYLAKKGYNVDVFTGFPYYPFGEDFSFWYKKKKISHSRIFFTEQINGVKVIRSNLYKPKKPNTPKRILHEESFLFAAAIRLLFTFDKYDLIVCISPPLFLGLLAYMFSRFKKAPFIVHIQDLQPDAAVELGFLKKGAFTSFLYAVERFIYKKADFVLTISEGMRKKIISKGIGEDKVNVFYDWANLNKAKAIGRKNNFSRQHGLDDKFIVLHAGNMGEKQDMRIILEAATKMAGDKSVCFLLVGRGTKRAGVEDYIKKHNLVNALLLDVQPVEIVNEMFSSCDVALITQGRDVKDIVMPSKVFHPASLERPLIIAASDDCEIAKLARAHNFGLVIPPQDPDSLVSAIYSIKNDNRLAVELGKNGRLFMADERKMEDVLDGFEKIFLNRYNNKKEE